MVKGVFHSSKRAWMHKILSLIQVTEYLNWSRVFIYKFNQKINLWAVLRWQRNKMVRPLSPPQIHQKNIWTLSKFYKTTSECWKRTSVQFSSVTQSCPTLCDPMNRSMPRLPVHHQLPEFTQTHVHRVGDAIQPSHPLSSPSPPAPNPSQHQSLFQWVNSSHEVAKVLEFQL